VGFFRNSAEVDRYIGGIFRIATRDQVVAQQLEDASTTLRILCTDPDSELTVSLSRPLTIAFGPSPLVADVTLELKADVLHGYFRGEYSILDGLAGGEIRAKGPISRILKVLPFMESLFPEYRELTAGKDAAARPRVPASRPGSRPPVGAFKKE
jgi:hypothetical protein